MTSERMLKKARASGICSRLVIIYHETRIFRFGGGNLVQAAFEEVERCLGEMVEHQILGWNQRYAFGYVTRKEN
jgi:hypothetical protein